MEQHRKNALLQSQHLPEYANHFLGDLKTAFLRFFLIFYFFSIYFDVVRFSSLI